MTDLALSSEDTSMSAAILGCALGEALVRGASCEVPACHGIVTTWTLAIAETLWTHSESQERQRALKASLLDVTSSKNADALRGERDGFTTLLQSFASQADQNTRAPSRATSKHQRRQHKHHEVISAQIVTALPLAWKRLSPLALTEVLSFIHRHPRVMSASAYWLGGLLTVNDRSEASHEEILNGAKMLADQVLAGFFEPHPSTSFQSSNFSQLEAEGALGMAHAAALQAHGLDDLLPPSGFDVRDAPERLAGAALSLLWEQHAAPWKRLSELACRPGDALALTPLVGATLGVRFGAAPRKGPVNLSQLMSASPLSAYLATLLTSLFPNEKDTRHLMRLEMSLSKQERATKAALDDEANKRGQQLSLLPTDEMPIS